MSTDPFPDADTDAEPTFEPRDSERVSDTSNAVESATKTGESPSHDQDGIAWKVRCRECNELVLAKPYCYECGAKRPADGDYYVEAPRND